MRKVRFRAITRIGPCKPNQALHHAGYPSRKIGDEFTLDLDHPVDSKLHIHLFNHAAITPIEEIKGEPVLQKEVEEAPAPPVVQGMTEPPEEVVEDEPQDEVVIVEEGPTGYPTEEELKPRYNFDTSLKELEVLNDTQIEVLIRFNIEVVGDLAKITDPKLMDIHGIGPAKIRDLRAAYQEAEKSHG